MLEWWDWKRFSDASTNYVNIIHILWFHIGALIILDSFWGIRLLEVCLLEMLHKFYFCNYK